MTHDDKKPGDLFFVVQDPGDGFRWGLAGTDDPYVELARGMPAMLVCYGEFKSSSMYIHNGGLVEIFDNDLERPKTR